jgi:hypothetical protein
MVSFFIDPTSQPSPLFCEATPVHDRTKWLRKLALFYVVFYLTLSDALRPHRPPLEIPTSPIRRHLTPSDVALSDAI